MADRLKLTVAETKARLTVSEFKGWLEFLSAEALAETEKLRADWKYPSPLMWYLIQLTQKVSQVSCMFGGTPKTMEELILEFEPAKEKAVVDVQAVQAARMANSKAFWGALADPALAAAFQDLHTDKKGPPK